MKIAYNKPYEYFSLILVPKCWVDKILFGNLISFDRNIKLLKPDHVIDFFCDLWIKLFYFKRLYIEVGLLFCDKCFEIYFVIDFWWNLIK